jgi:hypothetical protein
MAGCGPAHGEEEDNGSGGGVHMEEPDLDLRAVPCCASLCLCRTAHYDARNKVREIDARSKQRERAHLRCVDWPAKHRLRGAYTKRHHARLILEG